MRQVPDKDAQNPTYLIIGNGKVARHFVHYFRRLDIPHLHWFRRLEEWPEKRLHEMVAKADVALLLIHDRAINELIEQHPALQTLPCCHFSGSLCSKLAHAVHPLMTFHDELYSLEKYRSIPFVCDADLDFARLFPRLPNPHFTLRAEQRPLYHALCVMAGNFSMLLWDKLFVDFEQRLGLPRAVAFPYLLQVAENLTHQDDLPLTGPLVRGDWATIASHLEALQDDPFKAIYLAFVKTYLQGAAVDSIASHYDQPFDAQVINTQLDPQLTQQQFVPGEIL